MQLDAALRAGKFYGLELKGRRVDRRMADGAERLFALGLVIEDGIAAVRAFTGREPFRPHVDGVPARAGDPPFCKQAGAGFGVFPAVGTFNYKFAHCCFIPFHESSSLFNASMILCSISSN